MVAPLFGQFLLMYFILFHLPLTKNTKKKERKKELEKIGAVVWIHFWLEKHGKWMRDLFIHDHFFSFPEVLLLVFMYFFPSSIYQFKLA